MKRKKLLMSVIYRRERFYCNSRWCRCREDRSRWDVGHCARRVGTKGRYGGPRLNQARVGCIALPEGKRNRGRDDVRTDPWITYESTLFVTRQRNDQGNLHLSTGRGEGGHEAGRLRMAGMGVTEREGIEGIAQERS